MERKIEQIVAPLRQVRADWAHHCFIWNCVLPAPAMLPLGFYTLHTRIWKGAWDCFAIVGAILCQGRYGWASTGAASALGTPMSREGAELDTALSPPPASTAWPRCIFTCAHLWVLVLAPFSPWIWYACSLRRAALPLKPCMEHLSPNTFSQTSRRTQNISGTNLLDSI